MATKKDINIFNDKVCLSTKAICEILHVTRETLSMWKEKGCPQVQRGWWDIENVLIWRSQVNTKNSDDPEEMTKAEYKLYFDGKLKAAQFEGADLKNAVARGDYHKAVDCSTDRNYQFNVLKRLLSALSRTIATDLSGFVDQAQCRRMENMVNERTKDWLRQVSKGNEKFKPSKL